MTTKCVSLQTVVGKIYLGATHKGICYVGWIRPVLIKHKEGPAVEIDPFLAKASQEIQDYLSGDLKKFTVPLDFSSGTTFQKKVWKELLKIPYGKVCSYYDIAQKLGNEKVMRAVGTANSKNPICLLIPCHRVIARSGKISGYIGGPEIKKKLLDLEKRE